MSAEQPALFAAPLRGPAGPVEQATQRSLAAANLEPRDEGAGAALLSLAWALDAARVAGKFYGVAQAAPAYLEQARALGLTVDARKEVKADDLDVWLRGLTAPALGDPAQP